eukprot:TRINITY_DN2482_c0_g2_i1.p1 TRINITY_DN2482_c0_g2~~TRINITY_DN2482_c0_g2_i1.p1  ORF type:complete len:1065 (+),score=343.17 TRINITY_DN2482_c0_g2_i1:39-3197(+)
MDSDELNIIVETFNKTFSGRTTEEVKEATETIQNWARDESFCAIILDLIINPKPMFSSHTLLAFSAFLEDHVRRYWSGSNADLISDVERAYFHDNLLLAIYNTSSIVADQLSEIFFHTSFEFPEKLWEDIVDEFKNYLQKAVEEGNALGFRNIVIGNVALLKGIGYKGRDGRDEDQSKVVPKIEPFLREMLVNIVCSKKEEDGSDYSEEEFEIIFSIFKWFEKANHSTINLTIGSDIEIMNEWFKIMSTLICLPFEWDGMVVQEIGNHTLCKLQALCLKLFKFFAYRFIQGSRMGDELLANRKDFIEHIVPEYFLTSARFVIVFSRDNVRLPDNCLYPSIVLFSHMITLGSIWSGYLADTWNEFMSEYIIPLVCFDELIQEQWEDNSILFFEKITDPYSTTFEPATAALNLIMVSVQSRANKSFWILTDFAIPAIEAFHEDPTEESARACFGALAILTGVFKYDKNTFKSFFDDISVPDFVINYIIPLFHCELDFIIFRSLFLVESLLNNKLEYWLSDESYETVAEELCNIVLEILFNHTDALKCAAIIVLYLVCDIANFKELLEPYFDEIFENSFNLLNEYHIQQAGALNNKLIPMFPEKVVPSAISLISATYYAFEKAYEIYNSANVDENDRIGAAAALTSLFTTSIALLAQIPKESDLWNDNTEDNDEENPSMFDYVLPMVKVTLMDGMDDFIQSGVALLYVLSENSALPYSNAIWELADDLFELIVKSPVYLEDLMDFYDSLFTRGCDEIEQNPSLIKLDEWNEFLVYLLQNNEEQGSNILNTACTLIETIFVCYGKNLDEYVEEIMIGLMMRLNGDVRCAYADESDGLSPGNVLFFLHGLMCLVYYNPLLFFTLANEKGYLEKFLSVFSHVLENPLTYKPSQLFSRMYLGVLHKIICTNVGQIINLSNQQLFELFIQSLDIDRRMRDYRDGNKHKKTATQFASDYTDEWASNVRNADDKDDVIFNSVEIFHQLNDYYDDDWLDEPEIQSSLESFSIVGWVNEISNALTDQEFEAAFDDFDEATQEYFNEILEGETTKDDDAEVEDEN